MKSWKISSVSVNIPIPPPDQVLTSNKSKVNFKQIAISFPYIILAYRIPPKTQLYKNMFHPYFHPSINLYQFLILRT